MTQTETFLVLLNISSSLYYKPIDATVPSHPCFDSMERIY